MQSAPSTIDESIAITLRPGSPHQDDRRVHTPVDQGLDPQPRSQQRRQHHAGVGNRSLIIKSNHESVRRIMQVAS